ncbi:MAG: FecR domain-containing protein [Deltaproteobacteria bacterium]|nr:FecR domain-containing protein [Deltaproteobacteria bacterium]
MDSDSRRLEVLGAAIADVEAALLGRRDGVERAVARRRLIDAVAYRRAAAPRIAAAVVAAALAATLVMLAWPSSDTTRPGAPPHEEGASTKWLAAPPDAPLPARLRDGTELELGAGGRARVEREGTAATAITLESGELRVHMPRLAGTRRHVDAGPFRVVVTGTEFKVGWAPDAERFELTVFEGAVVVFGPLVAEGRTVHAEQTMRVRGGRWLEVTTESGDAPTAAAATAPVDGGAQRPEEGDADDVATADVAAAASGPSPGPSAAPEGRIPPPAAADDWLTLASQRRHAEALAAARAGGLDRLCDELPAERLARLADVARYAGDADAATTVLQALRRRFPGTRSAAEAAFTFGRMVFDARGNSLAAAAWFETYLREAPDGPWAQEALGRLIEAYDGLGSPEAAARAALRYLERFPDGPQSELARRLAGP